MAANGKTPATYWERRAWLRGLDCSTAVKFVLLTLHEYAGNDEWAFPHQETLAADVSLSERMVRRHLDWAEARGLLEVDRTQRGNRYRIDFTWPGYNRRRYDPAPRPASVEASGQRDDVALTRRADTGPLTPSKLRPDNRSSMSGEQHPNVPSDRSPMSGGTGHPRPVTSDIHDRSDRTPMSGAYRTPRELPSEPPKNIPAKDVVERRMVPEEIQPDEFASLEQGQRRFEQLVAANKLPAGDRLRFLTLWAYVDRRRTSTQPEDRIGNPGGFVADCVRRRQWAGALCDEDRVRTWSRGGPSKPPSHPDIARPTRTETPVRNLMDDFLALRGLRTG